MKRFYLLAEGQTEETFVRELLTPHYARLGVYITPIILNTSPGYRGGVASYAKVKPQIVRLCRQDPAAVVTTMIDLYALPNDFPGKTDRAYPAKGSGMQKAEFIETRLKLDVGERNFLPHLTVHEFEAFLFVEPEHFGDWTDSAEVIDQIRKVAEAYDTPEDINDNPLTAPSKRILRLMPSYKKTFHGPLITTEAGLDALRRSCRHFDAWLSCLEGLAT